MDDLEVEESVPDRLTSVLETGREDVEDDGEEPEPAPELPPEIPVAALLDETGASIVARDEGAVPEAPPPVDVAMPDDLVPLPLPPPDACPESA